MRDTSERWNPNADERHTAVEVEMQAISADLSQATPSSSESYYNSSILEAMDVDNEINYKYATLEPNSWVLDGRTVCYEDRQEHWTDRRLGWVSDVVSSGSGETADWLEFLLPQNYKISGVTMFFDELNQGVASNFKIKLYGEGDVILYGGVNVVTENPEAVYQWIKSFNNVRKIRIEISKTLIPERRTRIIKVALGIIDIFGPDRITDFQMTHEASPTSDTLPLSELVFSFDNSNNKYDTNDAHGLAASLQTSHKIKVRMAVNDEWIDMDTFYFKSIKTSKNNLAATITASDAIWKLEKSGLYRTGNASSFPMPLVDKREALRLEGQRNSRGYVTRKGEYEPFYFYPEFQESEFLTEDDLITFPEIEYLELYTDINVNIYETYRTSAEEELIHAGEYEMSDSENITISIPHDFAAISRVEYNEDNLALLNTNNYMYITLLTFISQTNATHEIAVYGYKYDFRVKDVYKFSADVPGVERKEITIDNKLIQDKSSAAHVANWVWIRKSGGRKYNWEDRGNPARQVGDTIRVGDDRQLMVVKQEFFYDGTLSGRTEAIKR